MPLSYGDPVALKSTGTTTGPTPPVFDSSREKEYRGWLSTIGMTKDAGFAVDDDFTGKDYDLRGFYDKYGPVNVNVKGGQHFTDEFKLPNHETFSTESRYAVGDNAARAGHWNGDTYVPPGAQPIPDAGGLTYGAPRSLKNIDDTNPPPENPVKPDGVWMNTLDDRDKAALKRWYEMPWFERKLMPEPEVLRVTRQRRDQAVGAQDMKEDPWSTTLGKVFTNAPTQLRMQFAGIFRSGAAPVSRQVLNDNAFMSTSDGSMPYRTDLDPKLAPSNYQLAAAFGFSKNTVPKGTDPVDAFAAYLDTPEGKASAELAAKETPLALKAQEWWDADTGKLRENMPAVRPHSLKYYAAGTLESVINMAPAVGATLATKNPEIGLAIMGTQVYGETYGQLKDAGYSHDQAVSGAMFSAAIQTLTEGIPLGILTSNRFMGLKKILAASGAESVQNTLQEALQMGYDTGVLDQNMTMGEAAWRLMDAGLIGFAAGTTFGSAAVAVDKLRTPAGQEHAKDQATLEDVGARVEERVADETRAAQASADVQDLQVIAEGGEIPPDRLQQLANAGYIKLSEVVSTWDENAANQGSAASPRAGAAAAPEEIAPGGLEAGRADRAHREGGARRPSTIGLDALGAAGESGPGSAAAGGNTAILLPAGRRRITTAGQEAEAAALRRNLAAQGVSPADLRPTVEILQKPAQAAAAEAVTVEPTEAQKEAGNYKKGRFMWNGRQVAIETPAGAQRTGIDPNGQPWSQTMTAGYGYFPGKPGADHVEGRPTEGIDAYVGPDVSYPMAYVINQTNAEGSFDEHKVMVGYRSAAAALKAYRENHAPASGKAVSYVTMPPDQFKAWLDTADHRLPAERLKTVPNFRAKDDTVPTAERYALRGNRPVGAPPAVKTLDHVDDQINDFVKVLEDSKLIPEEAWTWYEDSGQAIRDVTQGDPARMHDVVKTLAVLSQASGVATNTGAMVKAAYEIAKGNKAPKVGRYPNAMAKNIETVLNAPEITSDLPGIGEKLSSFYRNLYDSTFNTRKYDQDVTIDRWMARIMKYRGDAVLGTQYKYARKVFADAVTRFNARNGTDWLPRNAQAALWVHERSRASIEKGGKFMPTDTFSTHLDATKARVVHEAVPSSSTPEGRLISSLDADAKSDYTRKAIGHYIKGEKNELMEALGVPLYKGTPGSGGYESQITPNEISNVVMLKGGEGYDRATADTVARSYMFMHQQDAVPWFRADRNANTNSKKFSQGVEIQFDHELTHEDEQQLFKQLQLELGMFAGYTKTAPNTVTIIDFKDESGKTTSGKSPQEFIGSMERAAAAMHDDVPVAKVEKFGAEGNYLTHDWEKDPNGEALQSQISSYAKARQRPDLLERVRDWRDQIRRTTDDFASKASKQRPVADAVPVDRLDGGSESEHEIYGRFGKLATGRDTTKQLKFYDLERLVDNPQITTDMLAELGYQAETFSFEPDNFRIPKFGKQNYTNGVVWIYDPSAAHGSFKDTNYTKAWRESHEAGHGVVEPFLAQKYGPSRRYGRMGRPMIGERGVPPKRVKVELQPLTLKQAQRSIEWEDAAFRAQRMLLEDVGVRIDEATFNREYNTNLSDAMYRVLTGEFGNPGEIGFMPSAERTSVRDVLESLQMTEEGLAAEQGREPTEGTNLEQWQPISDKQIRAAIDARRRKPVLAHVAETMNVPRDPTLAPRERTIEDRMAAIVGSFDVARADYSRIPASLNGKILNTDIARELSPDYLADRTQSAAVHEPASWFMKKLFGTMLTETPPMGAEREVLFTGGGTGAGKTSSLAQIAEARSALGRAHIIFDSNLNNYESAVAKIEQAIGAGHKVNILYTWRDPVDAFVNGTLKRSMHQEADYGSGRTVPLQVHAETHTQGYETVGRLEERYRGHPDVAIRIIDNSRGPGNAVLLSSIKEVKGTNTAYNPLLGKLHEQLEQQFAAGRISEPVYQATLGHAGVSETGERAGRRGSEEPQLAATDAAASVTPLRGVDPKLLKSLADEFVAAHPHAPHIRIIARRDASPPEVAEYLKFAPPQGVDALFYPGAEGARLYLFADQFKSTRDAVIAMYHESIGHYGLKSVLGSDWTSTMDRIATAMPEATARAALRNNLDLKDEYERLVAAEEAVAYRAEQLLIDGKLTPETWVSKLIDSIKIKIARLRGIQMTDTEVLRLIRKARLFVAAPWGARMGARRVMSPPVLHSRLWNALNDVRVKDAADYKYYGAEVWSQIRNGNIAKEDADPLLDWITSRDGPIEKTDLMDVVRTLGNDQAIEAEQYDGRRRAVFHGNLDDGFTLPEGSKTHRLWNLLVYKAQDKFIDLLNVEKAIEQQTGRKLPVELDTYLAEELYHGKVKERVDAYNRNHVEPLIKLMKDSGYTWDEVEWYLYARHAPEANAQLYKINWGTPEMLRRRQRSQERANAKYENRLAALDAQKAKVRVRIQAEHESAVRAAEAVHKTEMKRVPKQQVAHEGKPKYRESPVREINERRQKAIDRSAARLQRQIDALEGRIQLQRAEHTSLLGTELAAADSALREAVRERAQEDPGLLALSGMSDAEAADVMDVLGQKGDTRKLEEIGRHVDGMTAANRSAMVEAGLETPETIQAWQETYKAYVPLKGWKDGAGNTTFLPKKGKGFDTGGALQKRRLGRRTMAANILANIVAQAQSTSILAEKAKVGRTFLNLVKQYPNTELWAVNEVEKKKFIDRKTGLVVTGHDPTYQLRDNVFRVKVSGKDYHVTFNEESAPAMRMAKSLKNLSAAEMNFFFRSLLALNRILSAVNTGYNPEFVMTNPMRDIQAAVINMTSNEADRVKSKIIRDVFRAHQGVRRGLGMFSLRDTAKPDPWREAFDDYREQGAMVGWLDNYREVTDLEKKLKRDMAHRDAGLVSWATLDRLKNMIDGENQSVENAVRLSTYKNLIDIGMDKPRAASIAKNLTVNFNRKGDVGTAMNALYLFSNASIQGMAVMWKAAKNPKTRKIMYGVVAFAAALDIINRILGGQDDDGENRYDKIPEYVKDHNLIVMLPEKYSRGATKFDDHYLTFPLPYGYNFLHSMGRVIGSNFDYFALGNKRTNDTIADVGQIMSSALSAFNPIGTGPTFLQTVTPTVLTPLVQSGENVSWYGGPVVPPTDPWDPSQLPDSQRYFESARSHDIELAQFLNELGGGTDARPAKVSWLDISPQTIQLWEDFLTGGAGKFAQNLVELGVMAKNDKYETKNIPFVRRLIGHQDRRAVTDAFYANRTEVSYATDEVASALKKVGMARTPADRSDAQTYVRQVQQRYRNELTMAPVMQLLENQLKDLNHLRKAIKDTDRPAKEDESQKIELQKAELMNKFNRKYNELKDRSRGKPALATIFPFVAGAKDKSDAAGSLKAAGLPAAADLIQSLPARLSTDQQQQIQQATER